MEDCDRYEIHVENNTNMLFLSREFYEIPKEILTTIVWQKKARMNMLNQQFQPFFSRS